MTENNEGLSLMRPQYVDMFDFVVVFTPHFLQQMKDRSNLLPSIRLSRSLVGTIWNRAAPEQTVGFKFGNGFVYCRRTYNKRRQRWELEFISFTPNSNFHTRNLQFAVEIEV